MAEITEIIEKLPDRQIVEKILKGEKQLYATLVERYKNLVFRIAINSLKNTDQAEDASQEAFLRAFQNLDRLQNPASFGSWIYSIIKNVCRNMKRKKRYPTVSFEEVENRLIKEELEEDSLFTEEMIQALRRILKDIPLKHRRIIELRYTKGFSCKKIADFLGITERSVINRLYYARKMILKMFKKEGLA